MRVPPPIQEGLYWAKWRIADDVAQGTEPDRWRVVDVRRWPARDELRAFVPGIPRSQSVENFYWGPGPLTPPGRRAD